MTIVLQVWLGVAATIHANATVSAGANDDAQASDQTRGFASVAADVAVVRPAAPLQRRGISFDIDETGLMPPGPQPPPGMRIWALTSLDPNEVNAVQVQVDATGMTSGERCERCDGG